MATIAERYARLKAQADAVVARKPRRWGKSRTLTECERRAKRRAYERRNRKRWHREAMDAARAGEQARLEMLVDRPRGLPRSTEV